MVVTPPYRPGPAWWVRSRSVAAILAVAWGTLGTAQARHEHLVPVILVVLAASAGWLMSMVDGPARAVVGGLLILVGAGLAAVILVPPSPTMVYPAVGAQMAVYRLPVRLGLAGAAAAAVAALVGLLGRGVSSLLLVVVPAVIAVGAVAGLIRRQNAALVYESQRTREEHARAAALAERARIAREIHDVLAHSLAALTVQLETADALLEGGRAGQARESVLRAGKLAREGLAETKRAIGALRGDYVPLPDLLSELAAGYRSDLSAAAFVAVHGTARELPPDAALALYRTAQEAMTNVRKHAPGAPVDISVEFGSDDVALTVESGRSTQDAELSAAGGGYGLTGLRERAELLGGTFAAGASGDGWRVAVRIPASAQDEPGEARGGEGREGSAWTRSG